MKRVTEYWQWLNQHGETGYAIIRIYLGIALLVRGWILFSDPSAITQLAGGQQVYWWYSYIVGAHLVGGLLLAGGFLTRLAALLQLPILTGAVFFIHLHEGLATASQSLELAALVLVLLIVYLLFGSGPLAVDHYLTRQNSKNQTALKGAGIQA